MFISIISSCLLLPVSIVIGIIYMIFFCYSQKDELRPCDNCADNPAMVWCPECESQVFCEGCSEVLHRARQKRDHDLKDIATAPRPKKEYVPHVSGKDTMECLYVSLTKHEEGVWGGA